MTDQDFERKEKARQDAMFDAQFADEPTSDVDYADEPIIAKSMTDRELMQMALDALANFDLDVRLKVIPALRARLAQPEPKPVAFWRSKDSLAEGWDELSFERAFDDDVPLYTAPPQVPQIKQRTGDCLLTGVCAAEGHRIQKPRREWQGLTDEDWIIGKRSADYIAGAEWAEAKLKEKNT
jgi:hypothetical protein